VLKNPRQQLTIILTVVFPGVKQWSDRPTQPNSTQLIWERRTSESWSSMELSALITAQRHSIAQHVRISMADLSLRLKDPDRAHLSVISGNENVAYTFLRQPTSIRHAPINQRSRTRMSNIR